MSGDDAVLIVLAFAVGAVCVGVAVIARRGHQAGWPERVRRQIRALPEHHRSLERS